MQDYEQVEVRVVLDSDAVVDPLAVVVEAFNTLVTNVAVSRVCGANDFAVWT